MGLVTAAAAGFDATLPHQRYTRTAIALHWTIAGLIGANVIMGYVCAKSDLPGEEMVMNLHKVTGIVILGLSLFRLGWRLTHRPPAFAFASALQRRAAGLVHGLLYFLMLALPITGWIVTSSFPKRHPISLGFIDIPFLPLGASLPRAMAAHSAHSVLAIAMVALVAGHVVAALHHHFLLKDKVITRLVWQRRR